MIVCLVHVVCLPEAFTLVADDVDGAAEGERVPVMSTLSPFDGILLLLLPGTLTPLFLRLVSHLFAES